MAWLCFREEPKAISKVKARYDILHLEALFLGRVKTGGRDTRKDVSLQVLAHWATVKIIIFVCIDITNLFFPEASKCKNKMLAHSVSTDDLLVQGGQLSKLS